MFGTADAFVRITEIVMIDLTLTLAIVVAVAVILNGDTWSGECGE